jgi:ATP-binding protein involved in chromosome partitioning
MLPVAAPDRAPASPGGAAGSIGAMAARSTATGGGDLAASRHEAAPRPGGPPTPDDVTARLRAVVDPELGDDIVDLGMVRGVTVSPDGDVEVAIALTIAGCPLRSQIERDVRGSLQSLHGVRSVAIAMAQMDADERARVMARARRKAAEHAPATAVPPAARVLGVASGKGGVGKSSVTVNLAAALARQGCTVGVLDADIWGFSVPRLLGMAGEVEAKGGKMVPLERPAGDGVLRVLSMGFLAEEDRAIMWRGLLLNRAVQQFLEDAHWGDLDYLLIDLPPGTGDVAMGLARMLPRTEMVIVTTPPVAAQRVAARAADMARRGYLRVAGVVENMGDFTCEHGTSYSLFGSGGGARLAAELGVPLIGSIPLHPDMAAAGDAGTPVALGQGGLAEVFRGIAVKVRDEIAPLVEASSCTARLLDRIAEGAAQEPAAARDPGATAL